MKTKRVVVVLGMHRSGTSVLVKALQGMGVNFGERLLAANEWNPAGYFEHADVVELDDALLGAKGKRWDSLVVPPAIASEAEEAFTRRALGILERDFAATSVCGIKDPRASRLLPFWQPVFARAGLQDSYVIALRNPVSVARSLAVRDGIRPEKASLLWLSHLLDALRGTQGRPRVVVDYDALLTDPDAQYQRIAAALQLPVDEAARAEFREAFLSASLRHAQDAPQDVAADPRIAEPVARAWELLCTLAQDDGGAHPDRQAGERALQVLEDWFAGMIPVLRYLDACEQRVDLLALVSATPADSGVAVAPSDAERAGESVPAVRAAPLSAVPAPTAQPRVSVVIPLFNHEAYIEEALRSVLQQTLRPQEVIVIDDGSADRSAERMRELCREHPGIVFWSRPNQGAHHALNAAIHLATGDFVAVLNSDDCFAPERLAECVAAVSADPSIDVVVTGASFVDGSGAAVANPWYEDARAFFRESGDLALALFHANFLLSTSNLFIRRSLFETIGYFSALRYTHDLEFFLRLVLAGRHIHFIDRPLLAYRIHAGNTITENQARAQIEQAVVFAFFLHRQQRRTGAHGDGQDWLQPYVQVLAQHDLLEQVEYLLACLDEGGDAAKGGIADSWSRELQAFLAAIGAGARAVPGAQSLLAEFASARNAYLRRWERTADYAQVVAAFGEQQRNIELLREEIQALYEQVAEKDRGSAAQASEIHRLYGVVTDKDAACAVQAAEIRQLYSTLADRDRTLASRHEELQALRAQQQTLEAEVRRLNEAVYAGERDLWAIRNSNWYRLGVILRQERLSLRKLGRIAWYAAACMTPSRLKPALQPLAARLRRAYHARAEDVALTPQPLESAEPQRRVLHVIANFMLGGSSRLVVDLIEGLGSGYRHRVITSYLPEPPVYRGVEVVENRFPQGPEEVLPLLRDYDPQLVHVHYWGDCDWGWYDVLFRAVAALGCPVIENINTPVRPYSAAFIGRYVHVSNYVQREFGDPAAPNLTIYPGSDFGLFAHRGDLPAARDCIGMVYRLEADKLDPRSIDVFIRVAQRRPQTRAIIVGGGSFLEPYRAAVERGGVAANVEFTGYVDYAALPALYARMSVFVAPVYKESFGQVSPFAMNIGIPVVGYDIGGLAEIVDDAALLAPPGDSDALAGIIIGLLDDPARCREIGARNQARAQALFSLEAMLAAYRQLYAELLGAPR